MRLNTQTYPAFNVLEKGNYDFLKIDEMFGELLNTTEKFNNFVSSVKYTFNQVNKKYYLTKTFKDAITTAMPKIQDGQKHYNTIPCDCGIIFTETGFSIYLSNPTDKKLKLLCFGFTRDVLTTYGYVDNDGKFGGMACSLKDGKPFNDTDGLAIYLETFLVSLYFIHNCEIEQKILKPKEKWRENGNKHYNESNSDIIMLDCKWFTELIKQTPFHVKGHLRWQHHGEKFSKRKLIWISDFDKKGYIRKAMKNQVLEIA
jgi:hypothetical protein